MKDMRWKKSQKPAKINENPPSGTMQKPKKRNGFLSKLFKGKEPESQDTRMVCVYASPEIMSGKRFSTASSGTYPAIHAVKPQAGSGKDEYEDIMMEELYGSPEMMREYADEWDRRRRNNQADPSKKGKFCICGKLVSTGEERCPHCGRSMIDPEETGWFCKNCGKFVSMREPVCPYCGKGMFD